MSAITRAAFTPDATSCRRTPFQLTLLAGETILAGQAVRVKSDGLFWLSDGTADDGKNDFYGIAANGGAAGIAVTAFGCGARFRYATGLTPGARYFLSATAGSLDTAETTGSATPVAMAINATDIVVIAAFNLAAADLS